MAKLWRMEDPVIHPNTGKVLVGGMWAHQRKWWESNKFIRALVAGYGGGKTLIGSKWAISMTLHNSVNAVSPFMVVSPTYRLAKRTVIPTIKKLLDGRKIRYEYNGSDFEFRIFRGQREGLIWVGSGEQPDNLKGPNLCGALIDEPFIQHRDVFDQMLARVRDPSAIFRAIGLTGTPEELNWGYDICEGDEADRFNLDLVRASTRDNKALPSEFIGTLDNAYDDKVKDAYMEGQFVNLSKGMVYYGFERARNVREFPYFEGELHLGMDFNVNPMAAVLFWVRGDMMHIIDEFELPNSDTEEMIQHVKGKYPKLMQAFPDPSGKSRKTSAKAGVTDFRIIRDNGVQVDRKSVV